MPDYKISARDANDLKCMVAVPSPDIRLRLLRQYSDKHGHDALLGLFSEFIGMANSVIKNTREFIELYLITECGHGDRTAEKINLPTIFGALQGIAVAIKPIKGMCHGCAFRLGTAANQSPITSLDAEWAAQGSCTFNCHEDLDERGEPTRKCVGYARVHKDNFADLFITNSDIEGKGV